MLNSVRVRLSMWHAGVLALVLALFSGGVYMGMRQAAFARLDAGLGSVLEVISRSIAHEIEEHKGQAAGEAAFRELLGTMHHGAFPRQAIGVYQGSRVVGETPDRDGLSTPTDLAVASRPRFTTRGTSRIGALQVTTGVSNEPYRIVVAERLDDTIAALRALQQTLLLAVPLAVLVAGGIGYLLARKSLAPVVAMSDHVDRIGSGNLTDRIEAANPGDELGKLAGTFNRLLERLQAAFDRQRQFMADASHELRTPISVARTAAQVNLAGPDRHAGEYREALDIIDQQMSRLTRVVNDLFLLAQADTGTAVVHRRRFALDETVMESVRAARMLAGPKHLTLSAGEMPESPFEGDSDLIRQLLLLLLDNAVKYTPEGGSVRVELSRGPADYRITVADTGIGIPPEVQPAIFDRFFRVEKARSRSAASITGGAGLGLSIGRWIAETHGGTLSLESSSPEGSRFAVTLPYGSEHARSVNA